MKKLMSILMLAALTSGAVALSEGQSFAAVRGSRPAVSHSHAKSPVGKKAKTARKSRAKRAKARGPKKPAPVQTG